MEFQLYARRPFFCVAALYLQLKRRQYSLCLCMVSLSEASFRVLCDDYLSGETATYNIMIYFF